MNEPERFARCLAEVLHHEGGYVDHPSDPGGATNRGVTLETARAHGLDKDGDGDVDKADVRRITAGDAARVYREGYWEPAHCGALPAGVDLIVFDLAVNSGVRRARRMLQEALGVAVDGAIGPRTRQAMARADRLQLVSRLYQLRKDYYRSLGTFAVFGRGWLRRLNAVYARAAIWAAQP
jgi:lysozyme family protein